MFLSPLLFLLYWLLLGTLAVGLIVRWCPALEKLAAVLVAVGALLIWLGLRWALPISLTLPQWSDTLSVPHWAWQLDEVTWQLSGLLLLMITAVFLALWSDASSDQAQIEEDSLPARRQTNFILFVACAALVTIWAATLPSLLVGWFVLLGVWFGLFLLGAGDDWAAHLPKIIWHLVSLFSLWFVGIWISLNGSDSLVVGDGTAVTTAILLAAFVQLGVWPAHKWRPSTQIASLPVAWLLHTVPPLIGVTVLVQLTRVNNMSLDGSLGFTAIGLVGFLVSVAMLWRHLVNLERAAGWAATAQASLTFLIGMWGGVEALLAAAPVLVLATGILFLGAKRPLSRPRVLWRYGWRAIAPVVALAAVAGVPLTAGFAAYVHLYDGWIQDGSGILLMLAALLHLLLMTAVYQIIRGVKPEAVEAAVADASSEEVIDGDESERPLGLSMMFPDAALLLLGMMLLVNGRLAILGQLGQLHWLSWVALLLTIIVAGLLSRFLQQEQSIWFNWHEMLPSRLPLRQLRDSFYRLFEFILQALRDAVLILEGELGLLWLFGIVVLFLLL
ncbi:MAG: hypothetical protein AAF614_27655 [Chloroflexota bacterium]